MKRFACLAVLAVAILPSALSAQDFQILVGGGKPAAIDIPVWGSLFVDFTGYGLFAAPMLSESPDQRLGLASIGALSMAAGGICWNLSLDAKTRSWARDLGINASSEYRKQAWSLSLWATGCELGSALVGFTDASDPSAEGYIASLVLGLAGGVLELINIQGPRLKWMIDMSSAYTLESN
jgi:hypothetical protein